MFPRVAQRLLSLCAGGFAAFTLAAGIAFVVPARADTEIHWNYGANDHRAIVSFEAWRNSWTSAGRISTNRASHWGTGGPNTNNAAGLFRFCMKLNSVYGLARRYSEGDFATNELRGQWGSALTDGATRYCEEYNLKVTGAFNERRAWRKADFHRCDTVDRNQPITAREGNPWLRSLDGNYQCGSCPGGFTSFSGLGNVCLPNDANMRADALKCRASGRHFFIHSNNQDVMCAIRFRDYKHGAGASIPISNCRMTFANNNYGCRVYFGVDENGRANFPAKHSGEVADTRYAARCPSGKEPDPDWDGTGVQACVVSTMCELGQNPSTNNCSCPDNSGVVNNACACDAEFIHVTSGDDAGTCQPLSCGTGMGTRQANGTCQCPSGKTAITGTGSEAGKCVATEIHPAVQNCSSQGWGLEKDQEGAWVCHTKFRDVVGGGSADFCNLEVAGKDISGTSCNVIFGNPVTFPPKEPLGDRRFFFNCGPGMTPRTFNLNGETACAALPDCDIGQNPSTQNCACPPNSGVVNNVCACDSDATHITAGDDAGTCRPPHFGNYVGLPDYLTTTVFNYLIAMCRAAGGSAGAYVTARHGSNYGDFCNLSGALSDGTTFEYCLFASSLNFERGNAALSAALQNAPLCEDAFPVCVAPEANEIAGNPFSPCVLPPCELGQNPSTNNCACPPNSGVVNNVCACDSDAVRITSGTDAGSCKPAACGAHRDELNYERLPDDTCACKTGTYSSGAELRGGGEVCYPAIVPGASTEVAVSVALAMVGDCASPLRFRSDQYSACGRVALPSGAHQDFALLNLATGETGSRCVIGRTPTSAASATLAVCATLTHAATGERFFNRQTGKFSRETPFPYGPLACGTNQIRITEGASANLWNCRPTACGLNNGGVRQADDSCELDCPGTQVSDTDGTACGILIAGAWVPAAGDIVPTTQLCTAFGGYLGYDSTNSVDTCLGHLTGMETPDDQCDITPSGSLSCKADFEKIRECFLAGKRTVFSGGAAACETTTVTCEMGQVFGPRGCECPSGSSLQGSPQMCMCDSGFVEVAVGGSSSLDCRPRACGGGSGVLQSDGSCQCPAGRRDVGGQCVLCPAGSVKPAAVGECVACDADLGMTSNAERTMCVCPDGQAGTSNAGVNSGACAADGDALAAANKCEAAGWIYAVADGGTCGIFINDLGGSASAVCYLNNDADSHSCGRAFGSGLVFPQRTTGGPGTDAGRATEYCSGDGDKINLAGTGCVSDCPPGSESDGAALRPQCVSCAGETYNPDSGGSCVACSGTGYGVNAERTACVRFRDVYPGLRLETDAGTRVRAVPEDGCFIREWTGDACEDADAGNAGQRGRSGERGCTPTGTGRVTVGVVFECE